MVSERVSAPGFNKYLERSSTMVMDSRILIIVPAFKEEKNISRVIHELRRKAPGMDVVIIDDGSKDRTCELSINAGVKVLRHPFNMGKKNYIPQKTE